jgi:dihydrofolate reductase
MSRICIFASDKNGLIGLNGELPWHIPEDLKHFKKVTTNSTVIMGRKTLESLPGNKPLPNRMNMVLTSKAGLQDKSSVRYFNSFEHLENTLSASFQPTDCFYIGGRAIFEHAINICDKVYWTLVHNCITVGDNIPTRLPQSFFNILANDYRVIENKSFSGFNIYTWERE